MKFVDYHSKQHKTPLTAATANTQNPTGASPESSFYRVVITPELNSVIVLTKDNDIARVIPMDGSMFKDMGEAFPLLGEHPHVETIDCKRIANEVLDHFNGWYGDIPKVGKAYDPEEFLDLLKEMMIYVTRHHPMAMASSVSSHEIISLISYDVIDRIEKVHSDSNADE